MIRILIALIVISIGLDTNVFGMEYLFFNPIIRSKKLGWRGCIDFPRSLLTLLIERTSVLPDLPVVELEIKPADITDESLSELKKSTAATINAIIITEAIFPEEYALLKKYFPQKTFYLKKDGKNIPLPKDV